ncbi:MAG: hypothetical protein ABIR96_06940 [Bdellovibrionota bacterium]
MFSNKILGAGTFFVLLSACGLKPQHEAPHMPLDLSSNEYRTRLKSLKGSALLEEGDDASVDYGFSEDDLKAVRDSLAMGERSLKWTEYMNSFRDDATKLRLTTRAGGLHGIPIENPSRYSPSLVRARYEQNVAQLDPVAKNILLGNGAFTQNPAISDEAFVELAKKIDRTYQTAARWQLVSPWLNYYESASRRDVRGFYSLSRDTDIDNKLVNFEALPAADRDLIASSLITLCRNTGRSLSSCGGAFEGARSAHDLRSLYARDLPAGRTNWSSFFDISNARRDISWSQKDPQSSHIPFRRSSDDLLTSFIKNNVEEEYSFKGLHFIFDLQEADSPGEMPYVTFEAGSTPHVEGLGGNHIVMDANAPLTEWDVQWTIRHEFGHVLGLPDCYVEFFDPSAREMVNYQLDVTDLMCSRAGRMNDRILEELRSAYQR